MRIKTKVNVMMPNLSRLLHAVERCMDYKSNRDQKKVGIWNEELEENFESVQFRTCDCE